MFSSSAAGRVCVAARTTAPASTTSSAAVRSIAASCSSSSSARHQRRLSSSKASVPPNEDSEGRKVAAASKDNTSGSTRKSRAKTSRNASTASASATSNAGAETVKATREKKQQDGWVPLKTLFPEMPEPVRATNHLKREDVCLMQLFAGQMPISPSHVLTPHASDAQFAALFTPKPKWQKYQETVEQLSGAIDGLEGAQVDAAAAETSPEGIIHLDAATAPASNMDEMMQAFRNNRPPPPPRPIEDLEAMAKSSAKKRGRKGKSWMTTITVTEWMDGAGQRTFRADSTPIIRVPQAQQLVETIVEEPVSKQPFLERMRSRHLRFEEGAQKKVIRSPLGKKPNMLLISVKRQRKAKMKKHKLKKLRKRTRNLRRKLGKL